MTRAFPTFFMLAPGTYTAIVRGSANTTGIALVEVYDEDSGPGSLLANLSTRGEVGTGANVMARRTLRPMRPKPLMP